MDKRQALELIVEYEEDFDEIENILSDDSLTPSEKCSAIEEIVSEDSEEADE